MSAKLLSIGAATLLFSCTPSSGELPRDLEPGAGGGKADDVAPVTFEELDEPLFSSGLRQQICTAIGSAAAGDACDDIDFTVVRAGRSNLLNHADDGDPVTVQLDVLGEDTSTGEIYSAILKRQIGDDFRLRFTVEVTSSLDPIHQIIEDLAEEGGQFPNVHAWIQEDRVRDIELADLPQHMQDTFQQALQDRIDWNNPDPDNQVNGAMFADEFPFLEIIHEGEVIGYILTIWDFIDHPLWDGSGMIEYYDRHGESVELIEWWG